MKLHSSLSLWLPLAAGIENFVIPGWDLQSTEKAGSDLASLSSTGFDSTSWYSISARSTVFAGLIEAGVFNTDQLFFSKNLQTTVDVLPYYSPWLYRATFKLDQTSGSHYFLQTNGITSKADIYLNGHQVADKELQAGAYGGHTYDVTNVAQADNAVVIKAYPTDYNKDFALGFVDWNPYPPDNGTGVWRDVSVKQTGSLYMSPLRVVHDYTPGATSVKVTLKAEVSNLEDAAITGVLEGSISGQDCKLSGQLSQAFKLGAKQTQTISVSATIQNAKIWWPHHWGDQPLYSASAAVRVHSSSGAVSDNAEPINFGIRYITSEVNEHNDRIFSINGHPFQVMGGGYSPDIFLRWDEAKFEAQAQYVLDMGMNTIRLEGKEEQPELYAAADRLGLMVMPGWECCDKWEAWSYNNEVTATLWNDNDYSTANFSMRHEAAMLQTHPSILAFLVGSDYWPDHKAAAIYVQALDDLDWQNPIVCSAAKRGYPKILGPSGMKMLGPYDWVPPNYWYDHQYGAAFGFGSELGAGVGTPEIGSLKKFMSEEEIDLLWKKPNKGYYHMSTNASSFHYRRIYNHGLWNRYGPPSDRDDYLLKAQMMDYEATRAEYEGYSAKWNADHPATGLIYWMLNNAWPSLHWNQFDYYLHPAGSYFGTKVGSRAEHVAYDYNQGTVYLINHSVDKSGARKIQVDLIDTNGNTLTSTSKSVQTEPNTSKEVMSVPGLSKIKDVGFLRLILIDSNDNVRSRNVYWLATSIDQLHWKKSTWFYTPVSDWANYTAINNMKEATVTATVISSSSTSLTVSLENSADIPAFFIRLNLVDGSGADVVPVLWDDNYVTLFPGEKIELAVSYPAGVGSVAVEMSGQNVGALRTIASR